MQKVIDIIKVYYPIILFIIGLVIIRYFADTVLNNINNNIFRKEQEIKNLEKQIEILEAKNAVYLDSIKVLNYLEDSLIQYKDGVVIEKVKIQTIYENKISDINSYTISQIDSVLTDKYN